MQGLRQQGRYYNLELDEVIKLKIDLNKYNRNEYIIMDLISTTGTKNPISTSLLFSNRSVLANFDFGNKLKLVNYVKLSKVGNNAVFTNADESITEFVYDSSTSKLYNKEKRLTGQWVYEDYEEEPHTFVVTDKDGLEIDYPLNKNYPSIIKNKNRQTTISETSTGFNIFNNVNDNITFYKSNGLVTTIDWTKGGELNKKVELTYTNNTISNIKIKNINGEIINQYNFIFTDSTIEIINVKTTKRVLITIGENSTTVKRGYESTYVKGITDTIEYVENRLTKVKDGLDNVTTYFSFDKSNKISSIIYPNNTGVFTKYNENNSIDKESQPIKVKESSKSKLLNGFFTNGITSWTLSPGASLVSNESFTSYLFANQIKLVSGSRIYQIANFDGSALKNYTLSFIHGTYASLGTYSLGVTISIYDEKGQLIEEKAISEDTYTNSIGFSLCALTLSPTKNFSSLKVLVKCDDSEAYVGGFNLIENARVTEYEYNDKNELIKLVQQGIESKFNVDENGRIKNGNLGLYVFDKEHSDNVDITYGDYGVKTTVTKDDYGREISKEVRCQNDQFLETSIYTDDELASSSDSYLTQSITYTAEEKLPSVQSTTGQSSITYGYNSRSLVNLMSQGNNSLSYTYTGKDELKTCGTFTFNYKYDKLKNVVMNSDKIIINTYGTKQRLTKEDYLDSTTKYSYDSKGRMNKIQTLENDIVKEEFSYVYDDYDKITSTKKNQVETHQFEFDEDDRVVKEIQGNDYNTFTYEEDGSLAGTAIKVGTKGLLSSFEPASKKSGKTFSMFKNLMYRYPTIMANEEIKYHTYACFFDKEDQNLININSQEDDYEVETKIPPVEKLSITRQSDDYNGVSITNKPLVYQKLISVGDESETPINNFTLSLMFDAKIYINSSSMVLCRYGGNQEEGSIKIKFEKDTYTGKAYIRAYEVLNGVEAIIANSNSNKQLEIETPFEGWKHIGFSVHQLAGNGNHRSYVLQVDDSFVSVSYDDNSYKIKGLANASLSFGGYTRNNIHYGVSTCFISSVIVNFLETLQDEGRWEESELKLISKKLKQYREYDSVIDRNGYIPSATSVYKLASTDLSKIDIIPLDGSFKSLSGKDPIGIKGTSNLLKDPKYYFVYDKTLRRYIFNSTRELLEYRLDGSSGSVSIQINMKDQANKRTILGLRSGNHVFDLTNELGTLYYRKATSMDSSGNRVYTSTSIANLSLDGKRITLTWSPASNGVYFKVYVDSSLKTSFTLTGISLNNPYLFIGNDCDVSFEYIVPLAIKDLVLVNYAISSYSVITNALKNIRVNSLLDRYGRFVESKFINTNGTVICTNYVGYDKYNGISNNYVSSSSYKLANNELHSFDYCFEKGETPTPLVQYIDYFKPDGSVVRTTYEYDGNNRLTQETTGSTTKTYAYDNLGNMTTNRGVTMNYDDKKRLRSYGNVLLKYDSVNPYKLIKKGTFSNEIQQTGQEFTYCGNQIVSIRDVASNTTYNYEYDYLGRRTSKTNGTTTKTYHYLGDKLIAEISNTYDLRFMYDEFDKLFGFYYNDELYFYLKDALGTIRGFVDQNGSLVVKYEYDAWGVCKVYEPNGLENTSASFVGNVNPFRFKGYYYDVETQLFYCNSRYYSPELCRFISPADVSSLNPTSINGLNLYSYSNNNPIGIAYSSSNVGGLSSGGMISSTIGTIGNIVGSGNVVGGLKVNGLGTLGVSSLGGINWPKSNSVAMTHYTTSLIENAFIGSFFGNISYTVTTQLNDSEMFYSYSNIGNGGYSAGVGTNLGNWYGISAYVSSNLGFGTSMQLTPWITYGAEISLQDGISFSFGTISGNTTQEITANVGWGTIAGAYLVCAGIAAIPMPGARAVAGAAACVILLIDIFN